ILPPGLVELDNRGELDSTFCPSTGWRFRPFAFSPFRGRSDERLLDLHREKMGIVNRIGHLRYACVTASAYNPHSAIIYDDGLYPVQRAITRVMSSCCSPGLKLRTAAMMDSRICAAGRPESLRSTLINRASPNSSPSALVASVTPSVYSTSVSPGARFTSAMS